MGILDALRDPQHPDPAGMPRQDYLRASPPMFRSTLLDKVTRVHVAVVPAIYVPVILGFAFSALGNVTVVQLIGYVIVGYLVWTLTEYWLHRIVFHFEPEEGFGRRLHWMIHGVHHDHPNDPMRLVMPPSVSIPLGAVVFGVMYLVVGPTYAPGLGAGFFTGYLIYDMMHYYLHHFRPHGRLGRMLRERHMRHHFQDDTRGFGISAPYWDDVFRTSPRSKRSSQ